MPRLGVKILKFPNPMSFRKLFRGELDLVIIFPHLLTSSCKANWLQILNNLTLGLSNVIAIETGFPYLIREILKSDKP